MRIEKRSVVSEPIVDEHSVLLLNPDGDLIIDAPITSNKGDIHLVARNVYLTENAAIKADDRRITISTMEQFICENGSTIVAKGDITIEGINDQILGAKMKTPINAQIRFFDHRQLKQMDTLLNNEVVVIAEEKDETVPLLTNEPHEEQERLPSLVNEAAKELLRVRRF